MGVATYTKSVTNKHTTPQSVKIPGSSQIKNHAGGYSYKVDDWDRLDRFLILGSEGGTYYVGEQKLTEKNAAAVRRCIKADGRRTVDRITEISVAGRAPKNDAALFALAMAASYGSDDTRAYARSKIGDVARIGTHLLHFMAFVHSMQGGNGRGLRTALSRWYETKDVGTLAYQMVKYQRRDGWAQRDILRLAHPKAGDDGHQEIYHWITKGWPSIGEEPHSNPDLNLIWAFERAKGSDDPNLVANLIRSYNLPIEGVPTNLKNDPQVLKALLERMPIGARIRQLPTITRAGLFANKAIRDQTIKHLTDEVALKKGRIHPVQILAALKTYASGKSVRGSSTWTPNAQIIDALNDAFYKTFEQVEPTGKRIITALDVSGSMSGTWVNGIPGLSAREACGAMGLYSVWSEEQSAVLAFDTNLYQLPLSRRQRLDDVVRLLGQTGGGGTNCALPITKATEQKLPVDAFVIYTDSETWEGRIHPSQALEQYHRATGIEAKLIVVAMASTRISIADSDNKYHLNIVGFDPATPQVIADFIRN